MNDKIPPSAWFGAALVCAAIYAVMLIGNLYGY